MFISKYCCAIVIFPGALASWRLLGHPCAWPGSCVWIDSIPCRCQRDTKPMNPSVTWLLCGRSTCSEGKCGIQMTASHFSCITFKAGSISIVASSICHTLSVRGASYTYRPMQMGYLESASFLILQNDSTLYSHMHNSLLSRMHVKFRRRWLVLILDR